MSGMCGVQEAITPGWIDFQGVMILRRFLQFVPVSLDFKLFNSSSIGHSVSANQMNAMTLTSGMNSSTIWMPEYPAFLNIRTMRTTHMMNPKNAKNPIAHLLRFQLYSSRMSQFSRLPVVISIIISGLKGVCNRKYLRLDNRDLFFLFLFFANFLSFRYFQIIFSNFSYWITTNGYPFV